jgi:hypothetical protein
MAIRNRTLCGRRWKIPAKPQDKPQDKPATTGSGSDYGTTRAQFRSRTQRGQEQSLITGRRFAIGRAGEGSTSYDWKYSLCL